MKNILIIIGLAFLFITGCEKDINVPFLVDADEIGRYLVEDDLGKTFFPTNNLISDEHYFYLFDSSSYYVDLFDSLNREVIPYFPLKDLGAEYTDPIQEFGPPFGSSQDAEVEVRDKIYGHTIRVEGVDTIIAKNVFLQEYKRYGYFMKLGDDGQRFSGWILRGFSGGSPERDTRMEMTHSNNQWFPGDTFSYQHFESSIMADIYKYDSLRQDTFLVFDTAKHYITKFGYLLLNRVNQSDKIIERVSKGEQLRAEITATYRGVFYTMSYHNIDSTILRNFTLNNNSNFEVMIPTALNSNKTWDFINFQEFTRDPNDTTTIPAFENLRRKSWVIPFKVE